MNGELPMEKYVIWWFGQWYSRERDFSNELKQSGMNAKLLYDYLKYFGIARNFKSSHLTEKKAKDEKKSKDEKKKILTDFVGTSVLPHVLDICVNSNGTPCEKVTKLANSLEKEKFKGKDKRKDKKTGNVDEKQSIATGNVVVAASKICWLYDRDNVRIIDGRAKTALKTEIKKIRKNWEKTTGQRYSKEDRYKVFVKAWNQRYTVKCDEIAKACGDFSKNLENLPDGFNVDPAEITEEWFKRRVLDLYLWEKGGS